MKKISTHMFWAYGEFSRLERICANSFIKNGYDLNIWTYGNSKFIDGATVRDASAIISEDHVFLNKRGSYASFSDIFRYQILHIFGGLYVDTDVIALKSHIYFPEHSFLVTERTPQNSLIVNNNIIYNPKPKMGNIIDLARVYANRFPKNEINWSELGPKLITSLVSLNENHGFKIYKPNFGNTIDYWRCPEDLIESQKTPIPNESLFLHLYNEMWNRKSIDKNSKHHNNSVFEKLAQIYEP